MMSTMMTFECGDAAWRMGAERREAGAGDDFATHGTKRGANGDVPCGKAKRTKVEPEQHVQVKVQALDGVKNVVRSDAEPETEPAETETSQAPTCGTEEEATARHSVVHVPEPIELDVETFVTSSVITEALSSEGEKIMEKLKSATKTKLQIRMQFAQVNGDSGEDRLAISVTTVPPCPNTQKILDEFRDKLSRMEWLDLWENSFHIAMRKKYTAAKTNGYLEVFPGSKRWNSVEKCTLEGGVRIAENKTHMLKIKRIQRVHNPYREVLYRSNCVALKFKPGFQAINERWMFHGTSTNKPSGVCLGSEGFDPRVCKETNRIGRSIHFCLRANVPAVHYAHKISDEEHQIILARVACGNLCSVPNYTKRVRPPCIGKETPYSLYDAVLNRVPTFVDAEESNFIGIFDAHQAMPDYLITFEPVPKISFRQRK